MNNYKSYTRGKRGIDDLRSLSPYSGDSQWPVFSPSFPITEDEYKANPRAYEEKITALNQEYINSLHETGEYGKEYTTKFNFMSHSSFDDSKPTIFTTELLIPRGEFIESNPPMFNVRFNKGDE